MDAIAVKEALDRVHVIAEVDGHERGMYAQGMGRAQPFELLGCEFYAWGGSLFHIGLPLSRFRVRALSTQRVTSGFQFTLTATGSSLVGT